MTRLTGLRRRLVAAGTAPTNRALMGATPKESSEMITFPRRSSLAFTFAVVLLASACTAGAVGTGAPAGSSTVPVVVASDPSSAAPSATLAAPPPSTTPMSVPTAAATSGPDLVPLSAGNQVAQVVGNDRSPSYTVAVPNGWSESRGRFVVKYPGDQPGPVLGLSVWDVGQVYLDPCHWQNGQVDPGPSVKALVAALVAQPMRDASKPTDVTLAGSKGTYLEQSVPADLKSSTWTDFDACDIESSNGHHDFRSWIGTGNGTRYLQVPGQVDRLWVLDVQGRRLVVDATYSPDTTQADREELTRVVESLQFGCGLRC